MVRIFVYDKFIYRLDGKHVVFGTLVKGLEVLNSIEACGSGNGKPKKEVRILDCGVLETEKKKEDIHSHAKH
jgi:cyclophilin family peptidyl-prolyl cis-trans isomerase